MKKSLKKNTISADSEVTLNRNTHKEFSTVFCNIRGINKNLNAVHHHLLSNKPHILSLTETQIRDPDDITYLRCPGYNLHHAFRPKAGVCTYVRADLPVSRQTRYEQSNSDFQLLWLKISIPHSTKFICTIYRSPNSSGHQDLFDHLTASIEHITQHNPSSEIVILGDFNIHNSDWLTHSTHSDASGIECEAFSILNDLSQLVNDPTRVPDRPNQAANTLDLFLTSKPSIYSALSVSDPLGSSDHCLVSASHVFTPFRHPPKPNRVLWNHDKGDWEGLRQFYSQFPWNDVCFSSDISSTCDSVTEIIITGMTEYIPHSSKPGKPNSPDWFNHSCAEAVRIKNTKHRIYNSNPSEHNWNVYVHARNKCSSVINAAKKAFVRRMSGKVASCPSGSRPFWSMAKLISRNFSESSIPPLCSSDGSISNDPQSKANIFAAQFASNSTLDDSGKTPQNYPSSPETMPPVSFTTRKVRNILYHLDSTKAAGPDGIPPIVLKKCAPELAPVLSKLYSLSYSTGSFPVSWKHAHVVPIPKKGDSSDPANYRPIALTSVLSKVMEAVINDHLLSFLEASASLSDHQYGFRHGRSTGDLLTYVTNLWSSSLESYGESRVVALDIAKAFDRVWHRGLLAKLPMYGVHPTTITLIEDFLSGRSISVRMEGALSSTFSVNSGVPQGSVVSPTLFLLFINDLLSNTTNLIHSFADDTTLHTSYSFHSQIQASEQLSMKRQTTADSVNRDLECISSWGTDNLVSFNQRKTQSMVITSKRNSSIPPVAMSDSQLSHASAITVLGMEIASDLSWKSHILNVAKSASKKIGFLTRAKKYFTPSQRLTIYKSQIRPTLEYCSHIWGGEYKTTLNILNRIQSKAIRLVDDRSLTANLQSLEHRRRVSALSLFYRYHHGQCSSEIAASMPEARSFGRVTRSSTSSHPFSVAVPYCRTTKRASSFIPRTSQWWNQLPSVVFSSRNLTEFKSQINGLNLTSYT